MRDSSSTGVLGFWSRVRALPSDARWLLAGICATRLAAYTVWPFLAVVMNKRFDASITDIGAQLSLGAMITLLLAPMTGMLGDLFNRSRLLLFGCALSASAYALMGAITHPVSFLLAIVLSALANAVIEPLLRARLGECVDQDDARGLLFHLRYYLVNLAVALGPMMGFWFANRLHTGVYWIAALAVLFLAIVLWRVGGHGAFSRPRSDDGSTRESFGRIVSTVLRHRAFLMILLVNALLIFIYAQGEDPLTFYLIDLDVNAINETIALLNLTNTLVVLVFHVMLMGWLSALNERHAYALALGFLLVSQLVIAANIHAWLAIWLLAIALATLAEIVVMPLFTVMIDKIAPPDMRGSYFGMAMLAGLGAGIAPLVGAFAIAQLGGVAYFVLLGVACIPIGAFGYWQLRQSETVDAEAAVETGA